VPRRLAPHLPPIALIALLAGAIASGGESPVPWPYDQPPTSQDLDTLIHDALKVADREQREEWLAAFEKGEDRESLLVFQDDIDQGYYDNDRLFTMGDGFFSHEFTPLDGYGDSPEPTLHRVHTGVRGGLDTFSCAGCHSLGGPDGAGSPTQNAMLEGDGEYASTTNVRNPPAVLGLGFVQNLAQEMSAELQLQRTQALQQAKTTGKAITLALQTKTVSFGSIVVYPDAQIDYAKLEGIDVDLTVRPFGWKGNIARLRRFAEDAARIHFGIQSHILALGYQTKPDPDHLGPGPNWYDPDNDGKVHELEEGVLTAAACYMAMLETPVMLPP